MCGGNKEHYLIISYFHLYNSIRIDHIPVLFALNLISIYLHLIGLGLSLSINLILDYYLDFVI